MGAVESSEEGAGEDPLTSRTPWVFAIGADGRVVAEGHGIRLADVAQAIRDRRGGDWDGSGIIRGDGSFSRSQGVVSRVCTIPGWELVSM